MCIRVLNKDTGQETDNPIDFADMLGMSVKDLPVDNCYNQLIPESCLCQVDIKKACDLAGFNYKENDSFDAIVSKKTQEDLVNITRSYR